MGTNEGDPFLWSCDQLVVVEFCVLKGNGHPGRFKMVLILCSVLSSHN